MGCHAARGAAVARSSLWPVRSSRRRSCSSTAFAARAAEGQRLQRVRSELPPCEGRRSDHAPHATCVSDGRQCHLRSRLAGACSASHAGYSGASPKRRTWWTGDLVAGTEPIGAEVRNAAAFLTTATARIGINVVDSACTRHEVAGGAGFPSDRPHRRSRDRCRAERRARAGRAHAGREALPAERAVLVLRDAFDYSYREIADILDLSEANARQLAVRARTRLIGDHHRAVSDDEHRRLLAAFTAASRTGDLAQLEQLLVAEVELQSRQRWRPSQRSLVGVTSRSVAPTSSVTSPDPSGSSRRWGSRCRESWLRSSPSPRRSETCS